MALPDTRHRVRYLFVAVMVGHILLISTQVTSRAGVSLLQTGVVASVTEVQRVLWGAVSVMHGVWDGYVDLRDVRAENQRLEREAADLRVLVQQERASAQTAEHLRALLDLRRREPWKTTGADVIGGGVSPEFPFIVINRGRDAGLQRDMPVITAAGVVGRVTDPGPHASTVQLIIDKSTAAAVLIERSRSQGVAIGDGNGMLRLDYLAGSADVQVGDTVLTAGVDGIYQMGLIVGTVERVERAGRIVVIRPAVDFTRLETVLVVVEPAPRPSSNRPAQAPAAAQAKQ